MNKEKRSAVIAGNWKMNKNPAETVEFIKALAPMTDGLNGCDIVLCVPFVDLAAAVEAAKRTNIKIGAENVHYEKSGAFTGEISASMLTYIGVEYVIVGHSERRQYFGETDKTVNLRLKAALANGLKVILCVGETLDERKAGKANEVLTSQTTKALEGVSVDELKNVIIAYEPVWAIGTGEVASPTDADLGNLAVRTTVETLYGKVAADALTVQYGGSMNGDNAAELLSRENIDGGLIGGASLVPEKFIKIIKAAQ